jgi:hypothetical protein
MRLGLFERTRAWRKIGMATLANPHFDTAISDLPLNSMSPTLVGALPQTHDSRSGWCRTAASMLTGQPIDTIDNLFEIFETIRRLIFSYLLSQRFAKRSVSDLVGCFGRSCR